MQTHESFDRPHDGAVPTERNFGFVFATVFVLVAAWRLWRGHADGYAALAVAGVFAALALWWHAPLVPLNKAWARFGVLLSMVMSPVVMALLYFGAVLPVGLLMRAFGKDPLRLRREPAAATYWIDRPAAEQRADAMRDQF
jgi:hypothetical protein